MTIEKEKLDWYLQEHTRIVNSVLEQTKDNSKLRALLIDRDAWEHWLKNANWEAWGVYHRLRVQGNKLWTEASDDSAKQQQFTYTVETEFQLAIWAAMEFIKVFDVLGSITERENLPITETGIEGRREKTRVNQ